MYYLLLIIILICSYQKAFWYIIGLRVFLSDILILIFILLSINRFLKTGLGLSQNIKNYINLNYLLLLIILCNFLLNILFKSPSFIMFSKGILQFILYLVFQIFAIKVISTTNDNKQIMFPLFFVIGGTISLIYAWSQLYFITHYGIDLDIAILQTIFNKPWHSGFSSYGQLYRISGLMTDPNHFGIMLAFCVGILISFCIYYKSNFKIILLLFNIILLLISIFFTFSRTGYITIFAMLIISLILLKNDRISIVFGLSILIGGILVISISTLGDDLINVLRDRFDLDRVITQRGDILDNCIYLLNDIFYLLFGVGFNNFSIVFFNIDYIEGFNAHNSWIQYLNELGILGFICFLLIQIYIIINAFKLIYSTNKLVSMLGLWYFSALIGIYIASFFYNFMGWQYVNTMYILILGLKERDNVIVQC